LPSSTTKDLRTLTGAPGTVTRGSTLKSARHRAGPARRRRPYSVLTAPANCRMIRCEFGCRPDSSSLAH